MDKKHYQPMVSGTHSAHTDRRAKTVAVMSSGSAVGRKTVSLNVATSLAQRNFRVLYGYSPKDRLPVSCGKEMETGQQDKMVRYHETAVENLHIMKFREDAAKMSMAKMEEMAVRLPEKIREKYDYFIYNVKDPYGFPDRYMLLHADVLIMVLRSDTTAFSKLFLQLEKLSFIPKPPKEISLVFNKTKDMGLAFDAYQNILNEAKNMNIRLYFSFMGSVPFDGYRQGFADQGKLPSAFYFPESSFSSSISLIASKIINY